jgi:hypothetical protein
MGTCKNDAIFPARLSNSFIFKGFDSCTIGKSFFPLIQTNIFCLLLNRSFLDSIRIAS